MKPALKHIKIFGLIGTTYIPLYAPCQTLRQLLWHVARNVCFNIACNHCHYDDESPWSYVTEADIAKHLRKLSRRHLFYLNGEEAHSDFINRDGPRLYEILTPMNLDESREWTGEERITADDTIGCYRKWDRIQAKYDKKTVLAHLAENI